MQNHCLQDRYQEAISNVLDWDIPEDSYTEAVNAQASLLAGLSDDWDTTVH